jgi:hypothetical protein
VKGDFTRVTFKPERHYSGVRMQQGRVQLDADWNEQHDIEAYRDRTTALDVIGRSGAPKGGGSFRVSLTPGEQDLALAPGRFYVDGILCELDTAEYEIASFADATTLTLVRWPSDDSALAANRWGELEADGVAPEVRKIASVDPSTSQIKLASDASAFAAAAHPRLRTATTYLTQPDDLSPAALTPAAADRTDFVYFDVWRRARILTCSSRRSAGSTRRPAAAPSGRCACWRTSRRPRARTSPAGRRRRAAAGFLRP